MAVKEYQQKETSPSTSTAEKKVIQSNTKRERWSAKHNDALVKLWKGQSLPQYGKNSKRKYTSTTQKRLTQYRNKIRNLKAEYKAVKENNNSEILSVFQRFR